MPLVVLSHCLVGCSEGLFSGLFWRGGRFVNNPEEYLLISSFWRGGGLVNDYDLYLCEQFWRGFLECLWLSWFTYLSANLYLYLLSLKQCLFSHTKCRCCSGPVVTHASSGDHVADASSGGSHLLYSIFAANLWPAVLLPGHSCSWLSTIPSMKSLWSSQLPGHLYGVIVIT